MRIIESLIPDSIVPEGEINPKEELIKVLEKAVIADIVQTEAAKITLNALGDKYGLTDMYEVTDLLTMMQEEKIELL